MYIKDYVVSVCATGGNSVYRIGFLFICRLNILKSCFRPETKPKTSRSPARPLHPPSPPYLVNSWGNNNPKSTEQTCLDSCFKKAMRLMLVSLCIAYVKDNDKSVINEYMRAFVILL